MRGRARVCSKVLSFGNWWEQVGESVDRIGGSPVSSLRNLCRSFSSAPSGLFHFPLSAQGLRPGGYSCAASRLDT